jgi:hypothetical protein
MYERPSTGVSNMKPLVPASTVTSPSDNSDDTNAWSGFADFHENSVKRDPKRVEETISNGMDHHFGDPFGDDWDSNLNSGSHNTSANVEFEKKIDWDSTEFGRTDRGDSDPFASQTSVAEWNPDPVGDEGHENVVESTSPLILRQAAHGADMSPSSPSPHQTEQSDSPSLFVSRDERIKRAKQAAAAGVTVMAANQQLKLKAFGQQQSQTQPKTAQQTTSTVVHEDIEILTAKANYFENEAQNLRNEVVILTEQMGLLAAQKNDLEIKLKASLSENTAASSLFSQSNMLVSALQAQLGQQRVHIQQLCRENTELSENIAALEIFVAESRIDIRNQNLEQPLSPKGTPLSPPLHQSVSATIARIESQSPLTPTGKSTTGPPRRF